MANIKIIDLPTGSPESTSFVEATQVDELAESGRSTVKLALNALGNYVAGQGASPLEYGNLETESTTLIGAANELHNTIGADAYDDTATYNTGDYCIYGGELYKCNDDNVTGAWDATKWDLTKVVDELGGGGGNADFVECTQAEYDAWEQGGTLDPDVMYFITDGQAGGSLVLPESIAAEYDDTASYTAGDFVMYEGILYKCNHISATGSFDPTKWDAISATDYINSVKSSLNTNISQLAGDLSDAYSSSNTYAVGDLCILGNLLYKCNTAITTPEAWTPAHWTATTVKVELALKQNSSDNSLNTTNKTIVGAINEVRNYNNLINKPTIPTKTSDLTNDSGFTVVTTVSWGTSITIKYIKSNFLLFISNQLFVLWFYGGGYANVDIRNTGTNDVASGAGTVTLGNITVTRTSDGFTVTTGAANATISVIG